MGSGESVVDCARLVDILEVSGVSKLASVSVWRENPTHLGGKFVAKRVEPIDSVRGRALPQPTPNSHPNYLLPAP